MPLVHNRFHKFSEVDGPVCGTAKSPARDEPQVYEVNLNPGEVLFLPVGWLHHVEAIEIGHYDFRELRVRQ